MLRLAVLFAVLLASDVWAGAWPRDKGTGFVSLSHRYGVSTKDPFTTLPSQYTAVYAEYGVTDRLTFGLDAGRSVSGDVKFVLFANWPVWEAQNGHILGVELGLGRIDGSSVLRPGLSYGYGFERGLIGGWVAADAVAEYTPKSGGADYKLDLTFGLSWPNGMKTYTQLQTGQPQEGPAFARIGGAVVLPNKTGYATEVGVEYGVVGDDFLQLKMGIWREF